LSGIGPAPDGVANLVPLGATIRRNMGEEASNRRLPYRGSALLRPTALGVVENPQPFLSLTLDGLERLDRLARGEIGGSDGRS